MDSQTISAVLGVSLLASPLQSPAAADSLPSVVSESPSLRTSVRRMQQQLTAMPLADLPAPIVKHVDPLKERQWRFPSDHLPIGMTFDSIHYVSWNVLDPASVEEAIKNKPEVKFSLIGSEHIALGDAPLTLREKHVVDLILEMISDPVRPRSLLSLQECSKPFLEELRAKLPNPFEILSNGAEALVLDRRYFDPIEVKEESGIFSAEPTKTLQNILVRRLDTGETMRIVNVQIPKDPPYENKSPVEFAQYLSRTFDPSQTTLVMGDMNCNAKQISEAMAKSPFAKSTTRSPETTDYFFTYAPRPIAMETQLPDEVLRDIAPHAALLDTFPHPDTHPNSFIYMELYSHLICHNGKKFYIFSQKDGVWIKDDKIQFIMGWNGYPIRLSVAEEWKQDIWDKMKQRAVENPPG